MPMRQTPPISSISRFSFDEKPMSAASCLERPRELAFVFVGNARQQCRVARSAVMNPVLGEIPALVLGHLPGPSELYGLVELALDDGRAPGRQG